MYAYNFEYDGKLLSDYGFIVCHFDDSGGLNTSEAGSEINFEMASAHSGKRNYVVGTEYTGCLSTKFQICKEPGSHTDEEMFITADEFRHLSRWLNRREYLWFHAFDWCDPEMQRPWVRATFKLSRIDIGDETVGVELEMTTDSPFGYGDEIIKELVFENGDLTKTIEDISDEIGDIYPTLTVVCGDDGKLTLTDDITGCSCEVENCHDGEELYFSGDSMVITTDHLTHKNTLANDFNYDFFRIGNTMDTRLNTITASMPCTIELRYRPIRKDTI